VDTWTYPVRPGDVLLLCSDGLTSMVPEERVEEILRGSMDLKVAAQQLIDEANAAGGRDNITVVLSRIEDATVLTDGLQQTEIRPPDAEHQPAAAGVAARPRRPLRRRAKVLAALAATLIVLGLIVGGGYLATRQLYFIGTNAQGIVTIYRGLPYDLPAGIHLYETFYVSGVPASLVPPDRRGAVLNNNLRSQSDASDLVRRLELGQLTK
jgi:protein phosphatase